MRQRATRELEPSDRAAQRRLGRALERHRQLVNQQGIESRLRGLRAAKARAEHQLAGAIDLHAIEQALCRLAQRGTQLQRLFQGLQVLGFGHQFEQLGAIATQRFQSFRHLRAPPFPNPF